MKLKLVLIASALLVLSSCADKETPKVDELLLDFRARAELKSERYEDALQTYLEMIEKNPNRPSIHSNVGILLNVLQKPEESIKSLKHALALAEKYKDENAMFILNFNIGTYYGANKDVSNALLHYQAALDLVPTSLETKTNIELLIQQQSNGGGQGESQQQNQQQGEGQNQQNQDQNGENKDQKDKDSQKPQDQQRQSSPRYKPRPFQGDQLSEGDVKKILGELRNQEQKIRANFDKKEKGNARDNGKDW